MRYQRNFRYIVYLCRPTVILEYLYGFITFSIKMIKTNKEECLCYIFRYMCHFSSRFIIVCAIHVDDINNYIMIIFFF